MKMIKNLGAFLLLTGILNACAGPFKDKDGTTISFDDYSFKVHRLKNSNSYLVTPSDFWHGTIIPDDYSATIKAVELVSGCKVIRDTFATTGRPASVVMGVGCEE